MKKQFFIKLHSYKVDKPQEDSFKTIKFGIKQ